MSETVLISPIADYPEYKITENGKVISRRGTEMVIRNKNTFNSQVAINKKVKSLLYLLAETFVPNPDNHLLIKYEGDLQNIHYSNIKWFSGSEQHEKMKWKTIEKYPIYKISEYGHILSYKRVCPLIIKDCIRNIDNIRYIFLSENNKTFYNLIHILVAEAFIPNPKKYKYVIHKDGNVENNHYSNLEWRDSPFPGTENLQWKTIPNYSRYQISEYGHVVSNICNVPVLRATKQRTSDYKNLAIYNDNETRDYFSVHVLVAMAFISNPNNYKYVVHKDNDTSNNHYTNLLWYPTKESNLYDGLDWRDISDYPGYKVSNTGLIKSYTKTLPQILKGHICDQGYLVINLYNENGHKNFYIHRIVAKIFIPNTYKKPFVDHIDRDKTNNNVTNLRWATPKENAENRDNTQKCLTKRVIQKDKKGNVIKIFESATEAEKEFNIKTKDVIARAARNNSFSQGFYWYYLENEESYQQQKGEIFLPIIGHDLYFPNYNISNFGTLVNNKTGLKKRMTDNVYGKYSISYEGKARQISAHMLVGLFFIEGRTAERNIINHRDENKLNPHYTNLEWVSQKENVIHSINRKRYTKKVVGELRKKFKEYL